MIFWAISFRRVKTYLNPTGSCKALVYATSITFLSADCELRLKVLSENLSDSFIDSPKNRKLSAPLELAWLLLSKIVKLSNS